MKRIQSLATALVLALPVYGSALESASYRIEHGGAGQAAGATSSAGFDLRGDGPPVGQPKREGATFETRAGLIESFTIPARILDLSAAAVYESSITWAWTSPAADNAHATGTAAQYISRYAKTAITTDADFAAASNFNAGAAPKAVGLSEIFTLANLEANTTYYAVIQTVNAQFGQSVHSVFPATSTLAVAPVALAAPFIGVHATSMTVQWAALPAAPLKDSCEGYVLEASTTGFDATGVVHSSVTTDVRVSTLTAGIQTPMLANTTYYFRVASLNHNGQRVYTALGSTVTAAAPPTTATFEFVHIASMTVSWNANGNPVDITTYTVVLSTDTPLVLTHSGNLVLSTRPAGTTPTATLDSPPLAPNSTYYLFVAAVNHNGLLSSFNALGSTNTLVPPPGVAATTFAEVHETSMTVAWARNGNLIDITTYTAVLSTATPLALTHAGNVMLSTHPIGDTPTATLDTPALLPNTTYYLFANATNPNLIESAYTSLGSTITRSVVPASPLLSVVGVASVTLSWSQNNPALTLYETSISTDDFLTVNESSRTRNLSVVFGNALDSNTTHYLRLRAVGWGEHASSYTATASTITLPYVPGTGAPVFTVVGVSSTVFAWSGDSNHALTDYSAEISTDDFSTVNIASTTKDFSVLFGTGGRGEPLAVNTTHYFRVRAVGWTGQVSPFTTAAATATLTDTPTEGSPSFSMVEITSLTFSFTDGGNPPGTDYHVQMSTDGFSTINLSSRTDNLSVYFGNGGYGADLVSNTTHYFRVRALSHNELPSVFDMVRTTITLPAQPAAPLLGLAGVSSVTLSWSADTNAALSDYQAELSTDAFGTLNLSSVTKNRSITFGSGYGEGPNLAANTTYYIRIKTLGWGGLESPYSILASTITLPTPPGNLQPTEVYVSSIAVAWSGNGNPPLTGYQTSISTDAFGTVNFTSTTRNLGALFGNGGAGPDLTPNTTYYFRVRTVSGDGALSPYSAAASTASLVVEPTALAATVVGESSITFNWGLGSNPPAITIYQSQISRDAAFSTILDSNQSLDLFVHISALAEDTTHYARVRAVNHNGVPSSFFVLPQQKTAADVTPPSALSDLFASTTSAAGEILLTWSSPGDDGDMGDLITGSSLVIQLSTFTVTWSTADAQIQIATHSVSPGSLQTYSTGTLLGSATYFVYAWTTDEFSRWSALSNLTEVETRPYAPGGPAVTQVETSSVTFAWTANGNHSHALYVAESSTDAFITVNFSSRTKNSSVLFGEGGVGEVLDASATYFFQVKAMNSHGLETPFSAPVSTITRTGSPGTPTFNEVYVSSIRISWTAGLNPQGTLYEAQVSLDDFGTIFFTSATRNSSVLFGAGGAGPNLLANATQYFRVRSFDAGGTPSKYSPRASTATFTVQPVNPAVSAIYITSLTVSWTDIDAVGYLLEGSSTAFNGSGALFSSATVNGNETTLTLFGLDPATTYYLRAAALNWNSVRDYAAAIWTPTAGSTLLPVSVSDIVLQAPSRAINLYISNGNAAGTQVLVLRRAGSAPTGIPAHGISYTPGDTLGDATIVADQAAAKIVDSGLTLQTTYYYAIYAHDSVYSYSVGGATMAVMDLGPNTPFGLRSSLSADRLLVTLNWQPVNANEDFSVFGDTASPTTDELFGYRIYRATSSNAAGSLRAALAADATSYVDSILEVNYFYYIVAVDAYGFVSATSTRVQTLVSNVSVTTPDQQVTLEIDQSLLDFLEAGNNPTGHPLKIEAALVPSEVQEEVLASAEFTTKHADDGGTVTDLTFPESGLRVAFRYTVAGDGVVFTPAGFGPQAAFTPANLGIYWFNGKKWVKMYGKIDGQAQTLSVQTSNLGKFQVRSILRSTEFTFDKSDLSTRFITPNADGRNDEVVFTFQNPRDTLIEGRVYNSRGMKVADLLPGPNTNTLQWDGKSGGKVVPGGVYLYLMEGDGQKFTGSVVIVR